MLVLLVAVLGMPALAGAQTVFKWVDANGVTNYATAPPPPAIIKVAAVNASPATNLVATSLPVDEALYWRERRQRELAADIARERARNEDDLLRRQLALQAAADDEQARKAEEARLQANYQQCKNDRRTDCIYGMEYGGGYGAPVAVVVNRPQERHHHPAHAHPPGDHPHPTTPQHGNPPLLMKPAPGHS